ncbi:peptide-methionine (S)-S-oxide reductase MsrA [Brevundimonas sp.]|uniref:peptide-methionine (S)-S-oxide reductase MsrA n=1 Tax=Brevundimonas sp. TaxID=1871086 RepID=UPI0028A7D999|nr:peptide-methionine (S)-S-oxide reductase MsrA [Brevundimonas sp.]
MSSRLLPLVAVILTAACSPGEAPASAAPLEPPPPGFQTAIFAGGCFWTEEKAFDGLPGVRSAVSGFVGGTSPHPTYERVVRGGTGYREAVLVTFDPAVVSYRTLVDRFWRTIDPTDATGQVCDQGPSYVTAVYATEAQTATAQASRAAAQTALGAKGSGFTTPVYPAMRFWPADPQHQDFARRHPARYEAYRIGCGRSARLRALWGGAAVG